MSRRKHGLERQMARGILLSLLLAAAGFAVCFFAGKLLLDSSVYGRTFVRRAEKRKFTELQEFVTRENVTREYMRPLDSWCSRSGQYYLCIYFQGKPIYETDRGTETGEDVSDVMWEDQERVNFLILSDGTPTAAYLYYSAGDTYRYLMVLLILLCVLIAVTIFSVSLIWMARSKIAYVKQIRNELDILAGGDLTYRMTVRGDDELGELAGGIDEMRRSIVSHREAEEQIREANSELITSMSHDLRTPLTVLIGYLELLNRNRWRDEEQRSEFESRSLEKAVQIKGMADRLFGHALAASDREYREAWESVEADHLFAALLDDYEMAVRSQGFHIESDRKRLTGMVRVDRDSLRRVFDNLFANLIQYADAEKPVQIICAQDKKQIRIAICNFTSPAQKGTGGTHIGLRTCQQIMNRHGGEITTEQMKDSFCVELSFPTAEARNL